MAIAPPSFDGGRAARPGRAPQPGPSPLTDLAGGMLALGQVALRGEMQEREAALRIGEATDRARAIEDETYIRTAGAKLSAELATQQGQLLADIGALRTAEGTTPDNYVELAERRIEAFRSGFLDGLDERVQPLFVDNVARIGADAALNARNWAMEQQALGATLASGSLSAQLATTLRNGVTDGTASSEALRTATQQWEQHVARLPLPPAAREQERIRGLREIHAGPMRGLIVSQPEQAIAAIDQGWGAGLLDDDDIARFRAQAVSQRDHQAAVARAEQNRAQATERAEMRVDVERVTEGVAVPLERLQAHAQRLSGSTDPDAIALLHDVNTAIAQNAVLLRHEGTSQQERRGELSRIEAQPNWRRNEQLVAAHSALTAIIARDESAASEDMVTLYARQRGRQLTPANVADFAAMDVRFALGEAAARHFNRAPQYLTAPEAQQLREQWNRAPPAERAQMIERFARFGFRRGGLLMRQVLPAGQENADSAALLRIATMRDRRAGAGHVREALNGWAAPVNEQIAPASRMEAAANQRWGPALRGLPGDVRAGHLSMARGIYSARAAARGLTRYDEQLWLDSYQDAWGRAGDTGGFGALSGGRRFLLPRGLNEGDMTRIVLGAVRNPAQLRSASGDDAPMWGNREMSPVELLSLTPVLVYDDGREAHYQFASETGFVRSRRHPGNYVIRLAVRPPQ